jgi:hypothetical protein
MYGITNVCALVNVCDSNIVYVIVEKIEGYGHSAIARIDYIASRLEALRLHQISCQAQAQLIEMTRCGVIIELERQSTC